MSKKEIFDLFPSSHVVCAACVNGTVSVFSTGGRRLLPAVVIGSSPAVLTCAGHHVMAVGVKGQVTVWSVSSYFIHCLNTYVINIHKQT